jgi:two-component system phosphate regulon sensor histidine kinase PhoR
MKQALIRNNIILMLSAFIVFFVIVFIGIYTLQQNQQKALVSFVLAEVELEYESYEGSPIEFVGEYQIETGRRITILDPNGIVLADTHDDQTGQDKSERPEVKNLGTMSVRTSATIGEELFYMAKRMDNQNILRVSIPLESQSVYYSQLLWVLILTSFGFIGLYYMGLVRINKNVMAPWDKVKTGLTALSEGNYEVMALTSPYPEINDLLNEMNRINLETDKHLRYIETYQIQLKEILNELKQGVMLFNDREELVYFNDDAAGLFHLNDDAYDKPSYYMIRDNQIKDAISKINQGQNNLTFDTKFEGKTIEFKVFHVNAEGRNKSQATVLVTFKDVTQERAIEQIKRDFFSHASHELKSPLTAIRGYAELIEHDLVNQDEFKETAHKIVGQTENMAALVEDMLMLSRLENLKEKTFQNVHLEQVLKDVINQLKPLADSKKILIQQSIARVEYFCDPVDMHKLFKNLIENAIKYSEDQKTIQITLKSLVNEITFSVKDQGIGIAPEHQQRVFERFYRVDKGRQDGGTGLGLAIVKHIVMKYEGTIDLKSSMSRGTHIAIKFLIDTNNNH